MSLSSAVGHQAGTWVVKETEISLGEVSCESWLKMITERYRLEADGGAKCYHVVCALIAYR